MIDFKNATFFKLKPADYSKFAGVITPILIDGEDIVGCYQSVRDYVILTTKRLIAVNVQGITGKKQDFTSLPYSKIQAFSAETAGVLDLDAELILWFSGLGQVKLEFSGSTDVKRICKILSEFVLG